MATYILIHGAGDSAYHWHLVAPGLRDRGHDVVAPDLPCEDEDAGWSEYADAVIRAVGERRDLVVVAQSLGGFTAPIVCARRPARLLVLVAGMVPLPGETGDDWSANTAYADAARAAGTDFEDVIGTYYHDVPRPIAEEAVRHARRQADRPGRDPWPLAAWPDVPTRHLLCTEDRVFPAAWMRGVVGERLGIIPDEIRSGHCPALAHPAELVARLEALRTET
jgi:pimeloyl-ACP methyl ester carboxylesterase